MKSVTPELADAITAPERVILPKLFIDWDNDGYGGDGSVDDLTQASAHISIDQVLTSNVPASAQPVAGAAVAQLTADLQQGHMFGEPRLPVVRNITTATAATGTGTISIARPTVQPGDTVFMWIANPSIFQFAIRPNGCNVVWTSLMIRGDFPDSVARLITGRLLVRRIPLDAAGFAAEPTTYTFKVADATPWAASCVSVAGGYVPGIHAYTTKGRDDTPNVSTALVSAIAPKVTLPNCLVLGFFAGWAGAGGGVTWTPTAPATELADTCSTNGFENATITVTQNVSPAVGYVPMSATMSVATEPAVAAVVALSPMIAGDDSQDASWVYSELNPTSLLAGKQRDGRAVTASVGFATANGLQTVNIFTGRSLGVDVSSRSRKATLKVLDNRELMRNPTIDATIPATVVAESPQLYPGETLPYFPGLESTWIISFAFAYCRLNSSSLSDLRNEGPVAGNGFFASPNIRPSTILHVPCHGSMQAFVGFVRYAYSQNTLTNKTRVAFDRGPYVASTAAPTIGASTTAGYYTGIASTTWDASGHSAGRIECAVRLSIAGSGTVKVGVAGWDTPTLRNAYLNVSAARVVTLTLAQNGGITRTVTGPTLANDQAWHNVGVHWDSVAGSATFRVDSTNTVVAFAAFTGTAPASTVITGDATITDGAQIAEWQVAGGYVLADTAQFVVLSDPFVWENFVPTAFIDKSENVLDAVLPMDKNLDIWQLVSQIADAEFAAVFFDSDGYPHYRTRYSDVTTTGQTVQRTLTTLNALKDIDYTSGVDLIANQVQASYTPITYVINGKGWQPTQPLRVPAATCVDLVATLPGLLLPTTTVSFNIGNGNTAPDGSGTVVPWNGWNGISIFGSVVGSTINITVCNGNGVDVWMVDTTGAATVSVTASWVASGSSTQGQIWEDAASMQRHGVQPLLNGISDNKWRQRSDSADIVARILLADMAEAKPVLTNVQVVGDPRLQIGDLVRFVDPDNLNLDGNYRLVGVSPDISPNGGFTQTLVARYAGCGVAIWDQSYWDDCTVWGA